jgi:hypothetical protein
MKRSDLHHAHKADLHFMRGDRAAMGVWLDQNCRHPYIGAAVSDQGHVVMFLSERKAGDAGASAFWAKRGMLDQELTLGYPGEASNSDWLVGITEDDGPRLWYVVFDHRSDADAFKAMFRKAAA